MEGKISFVYSTGIKNKISIGNTSKSKPGVSLALKNKPKPQGFGEKISKALKGTKLLKKDMDLIPKILLLLFGLSMTFLGFCGIILLIKLRILNRKNKK